MVLWLVYLAQWAGRQSDSWGLSCFQLWFFSKCSGSVMHCLDWHWLKSPEVPCRMLRSGVRKSCQEWSKEIKSAQDYSYYKCSGTSKSAQKGNRMLYVVFRSVQALSLKTNSANYSYVKKVNFLTLLLLEDMALLWHICIAITFNFSLKDVDTIFRCFYFNFSLERTIYQCLSEFLAPNSFKSLEKFFHSQQLLVIIITVLHKEHERRKIIKRRVSFCSYFFFCLCRSSSQKKFTLW
jgi:hypothetical protein